MSNDMLNTKEVADYLDIHEKQVYALIKAGRIPCTRVTGKWIFPKHLIDEWIDTNAQESIIGEKQKKRKVKGAILSAGSNDPNLDVLLSYMKKTHPEQNIFTSSTGSLNGLQMLNDGQIDIAYCHLLDPKTGEYNIPYLNTYLPGMKIAVVHLFYREVGFILSKDIGFKIKDFSSLTQNGVKFINRQKGSGTRLMIDYNLEKAGIDPKLINGYERDVFTHVEVGLSILSGEANAGIGTIAISRLFGLPFVPILRESFDMVLTQETYFQKGVQAFIDTLNTKDFRKKVEPLGNYDFNESGKIIHSTV
jgi:putative molybdopterin biosynthesis protein